MRNVLAALLCLSLTGLAGAQAPNDSSTSAQHANTEKTAQGTRDAAEGTDGHLRNHGG